MPNIRIEHNLSSSHIHHCRTTKRLYLPIDSFSFLQRTINDLNPGARTELAIFPDEAIQSHRY